MSGVPDLDTTILQNLTIVLEETCNQLYLLRQELERDRVARNLEFDPPSLPGVCGE